MRKVHVLLVEDNEADILLTREGFGEVKFKTTLSVVMDGWEAVQFIERKGKYAEVESPDLILLDINLPKMNGHEVLRSIKSNPETSGIPVIMFTTSSFNRDIQQCYSSHANCYITKPLDVNDFIMAIRSISEFWLNFVKLPVKINS
jgi:CheY-like chemotaxis protein